MFFFDPNQKVIDSNRAALGPGFTLAEEMAAWHLAALRDLERIDISVSAGLQVERALLYHALNLFAEAIGQILLGRFDTLYYSKRPLYDLAPLALVVARDDELGSQFLESRVEASAARKRVVQLLKEAGYAEDAERLNSSWKNTSTSVQFASHIGVEQLFGLMEERDGVSVAIAGGLADADRAASAGRYVIAAEMRCLSYLLANHREELSADIVDSLDELAARAKEWLARYGSV